MEHEPYMRLALEAAKNAGQIDEVPIGAVIVRGSGEVIATAWNRTISDCDPTAHAEILALRQAACTLQNYRMPDTTLYVTIEPCIMCMGAIVHARMAKVVFGAPDLRWGGCGSICNLAEDRRLNHQVAVVSGVLAAECRGLIQDFFREKRKRKKAEKARIRTEESGNRENGLPPSIWNGQ